MKIKLIILSQDETYVQRLEYGLSKYSSNLELYIFKDVDSAYECLKNNSINVFISERNFEINTEEISPYCTVAYFTDDSSIDKISGVDAVGKYQSTDAIYKRIVYLYTKNSDQAVILKKKARNSACKKILFTSFSGGTGTSCAAVACCKNISLRGHKVLYFNLESEASTNIFFQGEGSANISDIIYALKSKQPNFNLKLEASLKRDESGVLFYGEPPVSLDMKELNNKEMRYLIKELDNSALFDYIIFDYSYVGNKQSMEFLSEFENIVLVCNGEEVSNYKSERAIESLRIFEQENSVDILSNITLLYNKFSNKTGKDMTAGNLKSFQNGVPKLEHASTYEVVRFLESRNLFSALID